MLEEKRGKIKLFYAIIINIALNNVTIELIVLEYTLNNKNTFCQGTRRTKNINKKNRELPLYRALLQTYNRERT